MGRCVPHQVVMLRSALETADSASANQETAGGASANQETTGGASANQETAGGASANQAPRSAAAADLIRWGDDGADLATDLAPSGSGAEAELVALRAEAEVLRRRIAEGAKSSDQERTAALEAEREALLRDLERLSASQSTGPAVARLESELACERHQVAELQAAQVRSPSPNVRSPSPNVRSPSPNVISPFPNIRSPSPHDHTPSPNVPTATDGAVGSVDHTRTQAALRRQLEADHRQLEADRRQLEAAHAAELKAARQRTRQLARQLDAKRADLAAAQSGHAGPRPAPEGV
eukprot:382856-Prorocentrum_minimum.AAC.1